MLDELLNNFKNTHIIYIIQMLKEENNALSTELKTTKERTAGEGEESPVDAAVTVMETKTATLGSAAPANM